MKKEGVKKPRVKGSGEVVRRGRGLTNKLAGLSLASRILSEVGVVAKDHFHVAQEGHTGRALGKGKGEGGEREKPSSWHTKDPGSPE